MSKKIITYKRRRICRFRGCKQVLSIYNPEAYCHAHQRAAMSKGLPVLSAARG
ncbi:MAG: hypothetical protein WC404_05265 [Candidatus Omnitrophota bacterium]